MRKSLFGGLGILVLLCAGLAGVIRAQDEDPGPPIVVPPSDVPAGIGTWEAVEVALALRGHSDLSGILSAEAPPDATLIVLWEENAPALSALEAVMDRGELAVPVVENPDDAGPDLAPLRHVARASYLRGWDLAAVDGPLAVEAMMAPARWGVLLKDGEGDLVSFTMGATLMGESLDQLELLLAHRPDAATRAAALEALDALPPRRSAARAMAAECNWTESVFTGSNPATDFPGWSLPLVYDEDTTLAWHRQHCRLLIAEYGKPRADRRAVDAQVYSQGWLRLLHNPVGRLLIDIARPDYDRFIQREDRVLERRDALILDLFSNPGVAELPGSQ